MLSLNYSHYALTRRDFTRAIPSSNLAVGITFQWRQIQTETCVYQRDSPGLWAIPSTAAGFLLLHTPVLMLRATGPPGVMARLRNSCQPKLTVSLVSPDKRKCLAEGLGCKHRCRVACCFSPSEGAATGRRHIDETDTAPLRARASRLQPESHVGLVYYSYWCICAFKQYWFHHLFCTCKEHYSSVLLII